MTTIDTTAANPAPPNPDLTRVSGYAKAITYVVLTVAAVFVTVPASDFGSASVLLQAVIAAAGAVPVYLFTSNRAKTISAVVAAIAQGVFLLGADWATLLQVEPGQYIGIVLAALAAAGVWALPNKSAAPTPVKIEGAENGVVNITNLAVAPASPALSEAATTDPDTLEKPHDYL